MLGIVHVMQPSNDRLKQTARPVTALALRDGGPGTDPGSARSAPGHPAAYRRRYTHRTGIGQ